MKTPADFMHLMAGFFYHPILFPEEDVNFAF